MSNLVAFQRNYLNPTFHNGNSTLLSKCALHKTNNNCSSRYNDPGGIVNNSHYTFVYLLTELSPPVKKRGLLTAKNQFLTLIVVCPLVVTSK